MAPNDSASKRLKQEDEIEKSKEVVLKYIVLTFLARLNFVALFHEEVCNAKGVNSNRKWKI